MSVKALERHLLPLIPFLKEEGVTEVCINQPKEIFVEIKGVFTKHHVAELEYSFLETLAALVAEFNNKTFPIPLIGGSLPGGQRIQFVLPPACEEQHIVGSIRRPHLRNLALEDYSKDGAFDVVMRRSSEDILENEQLNDLYKKRDFLAFIQLAIKARKNILISGGTGTGKTTFLNACLKCIPKNERLITVEDAREVKIEHSNKVHLLFNEDDHQISALNIFKTCLRLRPDRILLSELRGAEVWPYLRAANSGHPGSLSTIHADNPQGAISQLIFMMQQAGTTSSEEQIRDYVASIIDIVIQLKRDANSKRYISDIYFNQST